MALRGHVQDVPCYDLHINAVCVHFSWRCSFCWVLLHLCHRPCECPGVWWHHLRLHAVLPKDGRFSFPTASLPHCQRSWRARWPYQSAGCSICCHVGRTIPGNSLRHYDVLLGWNRALHHVPGDDQQDNRQVGHISLIFHQRRPASAYHNGISSKTSNLKLMYFDIVHFGLLIYLIFLFHLKMTVNSWKVRLCAFIT